MSANQTDATDAAVSGMLPRLGAWSRQTYGAGAVVESVRSLGGHSAVTIGFDVRVEGRIVQRLVLKAPPVGVNRKNNFDVLRQVPILRLLQQQGIPAPRAVHWSEDERHFGSPYLMMSRLEGASLPDLFGPQSGLGVADAAGLFAEPVRALARLHAIDARSGLAGWNAVRLPPAEIDHWVQVLRKSSNADWIALGLDVRDRLHRTTPDDVPIGIVHGDFYSNNWVFDGRRLSGIVDWEGASIGPSLLDLGWVAMMYDKASWGPIRRRTMDWHPGPDFFVSLYRSLSPLDLSRIGWYRALAGYRLACITTYYYERHRTGKVDNPAWEVLGESVPFMLHRAMDLLA
ncbi:phosphotransferase family protein [Vineibacter terrae]|uniref:Phosphotransferase family protein n=1 Tax=Vineibacter terrae TaxID=2586908 RepID=A0A5C8PR11_9HYPH|nr:phosphotransferase family protein [Vineibacter terrae]TXL77210.1 phosphotransferase family protein [Vineibacter terrae]